MHGDWHELGIVRLYPGDAHETTDDFGKACRFEVSSVGDGYVILTQLVRCPDARKRDIDDYFWGRKRDH